MDEERFHAKFYGKGVRICAIPPGSDDSELSDDQEANEEVLFQRTVNTNGYQSEDFDSEDEISLAQLQEQIFDTTTLKQIKWKSNITTRDNNALIFSGQDLLPESILRLNTPHKLFRFFFL